MKHVTNNHLAIGALLFAAIAFVLGLALLFGRVERQARSEASIEPSVTACVREGGEPSITVDTSKSPSISPNCETKPVGAKNEHVPPQP